MPEAARRIEVFTGAGRRRRWSCAEKAAIVAESDVEGETVCGVARRHGLTPQQLFTWRRVARKRAAGAGEVEPDFVPVVVEPASPPRDQDGTAAAIELEIGGVTVRIGDGARAATIAAVIRALKAAS